MYIFISATTGDFYPGYLCSLSPWERWFLLRWIFQVILQYFVVKLEFTFQLYLICNEGWIIDERDSQLTKKWATTHCTLHYHRRYRVTAKQITKYTTQYELFHTTVSCYNSFNSIHPFTFILMFFKLPVWIWRGWTLFHSIEPFHHLIHFLLCRYSIIIL